MGSCSATSSIERVLKAHGEELLREERPAKSGEKLTYVRTILENDVYEIEVIHEFKDSKGRIVTLHGASIHIDALAERFPDCEVGY